MGKRIARNWILATIGSLALLCCASAGWAQNILISEIMYHPSSESDLEEYIEIYNAGALPQPLLNWRLRDAVRFDFPDVTLDLGAYLVIAAAQDHSAPRTQNKTLGGVL